MLFLTTATSFAQCYNRLGVSYNHDSFRDKYDYHRTDFATNGFGVEYRRGFLMSQTYPFYIELGANANMGFYSNDDKDRYYPVKTTITAANLQIPMDFVYRFTLNDKLIIAPYAGITFKVNLMMLERYSSESQKYTSNYLGNHSPWGFENYEKWNRFQAGWQVGVGAQYKSYYLAVQYGMDVIPAYNSDHWSDPSTVRSNSWKVIVAYTY